MSSELKAHFIDASAKASALQFGSFTLKSGRQSPYFFNLGKACSGAALSAIAEAYARTILASGMEFDVLFGPAYKGISIAALTAAKIAEIDPKRGSIEYAYNRKEVKDHGEGGNLVGGALAGRRVVIIDDLITAGTAITEARDMIVAAKGKVVGVIVAVDRQEVTNESGKSAVQEVSSRFGGVPVLSIVTFSDILSHVKHSLTQEQVSAMEEYIKRYGVSK